MEPYLQIGKQQFQTKSSLYFLLSSMQTKDKMDKDKLQALKNLGILDT